MTADDLLERYAIGERNFAGISLYAEEYARTLDGRDLRGINLCGSILDGDWSGVNLAEARMCGVVANGCDFQRGIFTQANLIGAVFTQCDLNGSDFTDALLSGIAFKQTEVCNSNLTRADLRGAFLLEAGFEGANLTEASLKGAEGVYIEALERLGCILQGVCLPDGSIYKT